MLRKFSELQQNQQHHTECIIHFLSEVYGGSYAPVPVIIDE